MLDFTSALYLGFSHESWRMPGWDRLTLGKPAALESPPGAREVERDLAALVDLGAVVVMVEMAVLADFMAVEVAAVVLAWPAVVLALWAAKELST